MTELFPESQTRQLSPRLAWMERLKITTRQDPGMPPERQWIASGHGKIGIGETEHDALVDLALTISVPLWNEEAAK